ncbi:MAG: PAS domain-containing protein [Gemmatimonadales bacterium]|nr:MAG: PAS domain-containing protein [Gemmatimonadales bacterium]
MFRPTWSIRGHLIALVLVTILPLLLLLGQAMVLDTRQSRVVAEQGSRAVAETSAAAVGRFFEEAELALANIAARDPVRRLDAASCNALVSDLLGVLPRFANIFVADVEGFMACSALPEPPGGFEAVVDRAWFRGVLAEGVFQIGSPQIGRISARWVSVVAGPVFGPDGNLVGVVGGAVDLVGFQEVLVQQSLPRESVLTIDDLDGVVVARSLDPEAWVGRRLPSSGVDRDLLASAGGATRVAGAEGVERIWGFAAIPGTPWRAWAGIPVSAVYAPVRAAAVRKALLIALALLAVGSVAGLLYVRVARSLRHLVDETSRVAGGEGGHVKASGPVEVRQVAAQFNRTLEARSEAEAERSRSLDRYRSVLDHAVFGIMVSGADGRIREANPALARLIGVVSPAALKDRSVASLFQDPGQGVSIRAALERGGAVAGLPGTWVGGNGAPVPVRIHASVHQDAEGEVACEWIIEDLTERLVLESRMREAQKLEAVGRLAGGVAHDFNNLLTVITTTAHLLREDRSDDAEILETTGDILDAAARGAALTRQLLTFSRKQVIQPESLELNQVVDQLHGLLHRLMGDSMLLSVHLGPGTGRVEADRGQLEQVLLNLVLNARDASGPEGPVGVRTGRVRFDREETTDTGILAPGAYVELEVSDQGSGIPEAIRDQIFEPFFTTKPDGKGTGLGLATVYGIVAQAKGGISVASQPGEGTVFRVLLPSLDDPPPA